jgi:hypothetical protein
MNASLSLPGVDASGSAKYVADVLGNIKVVHVKRFSQRRNREGTCITTRNISEGRYDDTGDFDWDGRETVPAWMYSPPGDCQGSFQGVGVVWKDYEGRVGQEVVKQ